jgi:hypothetical protein
MSIPILSGAAAMAAALIDAAVLIEQAGAGGLAVTCYPGSTAILVGAGAGGAADRAALVAALGGLAGAERCRQDDVAGDRPAAWLEAAGRAGGTVIEIRTQLAVRTAPGGTLAAGPDGRRSVVPAGQQPPPGWRWVTELDDEPGQEAGR